MFRSPIKEQKRRENLAKIPPHQRRLDALAEVVEVFSGSTCIAVCVVDRQVILSSNDLFEGSRGKGKNLENKQEAAIRGIYQYFQNIAKTGTIPPEHERRKVFKQMCMKAKYQNSVTPYYEVLDKTIAEQLMVAVLHPNRRSSKTVLQSVSGTVLSSAKGSWQALSRSFRKLEVALSSRSDTQERRDITDDYLEAFKEGVQILKAEQVPGVHAEMQILGELFRRREGAVSSVSNQEFYIGIGKLCCLNCEVMLEVTNRKNTEKGNLFLVGSRGEHDLSFSGWTPPKASAGSVLEEIILAAGTQVEALLDAAEASKIKYKTDMSRGESDSSVPDTPTSREGGVIAEILLESFSNARAVLKDSQWEDAKIAKILLLMQDLLKIKTFSDLFERRFPGNSQIGFKLILKELALQRPEYSDERELQEILTSEQLVGQNVAEFFRAARPMPIENLQPQSAAPSSVLTSEDLAGKVSALHVESVALAQTGSMMVTQSQSMASSSTNKNQEAALLLGVELSKKKAASHVQSTDPVNTNKQKNRSSKHRSKGPVGQK